MKNYLPGKSKYVVYVNPLIFLNNIFVVIGLGRNNGQTLCPSTQFGKKLF